VNPLVEGDLIIVQPGAGQGKSIAAFDRWDGRPVWRAGNDPGGYSSPMAATIAGLRQIVFMSGESLSASDVRDGRILWSVPWMNAQKLNVATPVLTQKDVFVSSGYGKGCALLEVTRSPGGDFSAKPVYESLRMRNQFSTCVLLGDHLYGFDENFLACMEFRTGKITWKERGGFGKGCLIAADGKLIVLGENGNLALVEARPDVYRELASGRISTSRCWALPSLAGGLLFVRDQETVQCFDLRSSK
jgi:outer membrane protein assembly factor BamB